MNRDTDKKLYQEHVKRITPKTNLPLNMLKAFILGGLICTLGQLIVNTAKSMGLDKTEASAWCSLILILISVIMTGFGIFAPLASFGGAGALVPITGFANGIAASALEFQAEGQVFGIGTRLFFIAGPVILYGLATSSGLGLIYWICNLLGVA